MANTPMVFRRVQYGLESAHGDGAASDTRLMCTATLPASDREWVIPSAGLGNRASGYLGAAFVKRVLAEGITLDFPELYYQALPVILSGSVAGNITPAEQTGSQSDYLWTFEDNLSAAETLDSIALQVYDSTAASQGYQVEYCISPGWTLTVNCDTGEASMSVEYFGDEIDIYSPENITTLPSMQMVVGKWARLFVDSTWAGRGSTHIADALLDAKLTFRSGAHAKHRGAANRLFQSHGQNAYEVTLEVGLERGGTNVSTEEAYFRADTATIRHARLEIDSSVQIGTGDTHKAIFDMSGIWTSWQSLGNDQDGNNIERATLTCGYDATGTHQFVFTTTTNVASI